MKIYKDQIVKFEQIELKKFGLRIADFLQSQFQDAEEVSQEELLPVIQKKIKNAQVYGLLTEQQIVIYVVTSWLLGEHFDTEFIAAQEMLKSSEYSPADKSKWLVQWTEEMFKIMDEDGEDWLTQWTKEIHTISDKSK